MTKDRTKITTSTEQVLSVAGTSDDIDRLKTTMEWPLMILTEEMLQAKLVMVLDYCNGDFPIWFEVEEWVATDIHPMVYDAKISNLIIPKQSTKLPADHFANMLKLGGGDRFNGRVLRHEARVFPRDVAEASVTRETHMIAGLAYREMCERSAAQSITFRESELWFSAYEAIYRCCMTEHHAEKQVCGNYRVAAASEFNC